MVLSRFTKNSFQMKYSVLILMFFSLFVFSCGNNANAVSDRQESAAQKLGHVSPGSQPGKASDHCNEIIIAKECTYYANEPVCYIYFQTDQGQFQPVQVSKVQHDAYEVGDALRCGRIKETK